MKEFILIGIASFYLLWCMYLAVMNLKRAVDNGTMTKPAYVLGYPLLIVGFILDVLFNWVFGTVMFLELPKNGVFTSHLNRHYKKYTWRGKMATWICENLLNTFDPSPHGHCKEKN